MSTDPSGVDPCPCCGGTSGVKVITGTNPRPQLFLDRLTATVVLRQVIALEEQAPGLSDDQLWVRLAGLARVARGAAVTVSRGTDETPDRPLVERCPRLGSRRPVGPPIQRPS